MPPGSTASPTPRISRRECSVCGGQLSAERRLGGPGDDPGGRVPPPSLRRRARRAERQGRRRAVDVTTESYEVARKYMVRLGPRDFADEAWVATLAQAGGLSNDAFRSHF